MNLLALSDGTVVRWKHAGNQINTAHRLVQGGVETTTALAEEMQIPVYRASQLVKILADADLIDRQEESGPLYYRFRLKPKETP